MSAKLGHKVSGYWGMLFMSLLNEKKISFFKSRHCSVSQSKVFQRKYTDM